MVRVRISREIKHCLSVFEVPLALSVSACLHISFLPILECSSTFDVLLFAILLSFTISLSLSFYQQSYTFFYGKHFFHSNSFSYRSCEDFRSKIFTHFRFTEHTSNFYSHQERRSLATITMHV